MPKRSSSESEREPIRKWTCASLKAGIIQSPPASITRSAPKSLPPTARIRAPSTATADASGRRQTFPLTIASVAIARQCSGNGEARAVRGGASVDAALADVSRPVHPRRRKRPNLREDLAAGRPPERACKAWRLQAGDDPRRAHPPDARAGWTAARLLQRVPPPRGPGGDDAWQPQVSAVRLSRLGLRTRRPAADRARDGGHGEFRQGRLLPGAHPRRHARSVRLRQPRPGREASR